MSQNYWMVSVQNGQAPSKYHASLDEARQEAYRLSLMPGNRNNRVYVLKVQAVLEPRNSHEWTVFESNAS